MDCFLAHGALAMAMGLRTALAFTMMVLVASLRCAGQEAAGAEEGAETLQLLKSYYRHKAQQYEFTLDAEGKQKLVLEPVAMTYTGHDYQSVANTVSANSGEVYIWTYEGRAVIAGGIGSFPVQGRWDFFHEFHVLTQRAPQPTKINSLPDLVWRPEGETPKLIPGAPAPASAESTPLARSRRLTQMRSLAHEFSGTTVKPDDSGKARLRLLPTPIYRLDSAELEKGQHKIIDGAVFVFTGQDGTDAEMLLSIECRKSDSGLEWTYVPAAMTYLEMWMEHKGTEVWHIPNYRTDQRQHNYFTEIVERITSLDEMRTRLNSADAAAREQSR
ncbi:MAG TPA: hypothetical protein VFV87_05895 [Pirellulaceae bacterium]|nr:hypothetical protein [Pirellulaceae bacterium]